MATRVVHSLAEARAALAAAKGAPLTLGSAQGAGSYAGAAWFKSLIEQAKSEFPGTPCDAVLDCGADAGAALAALRLGLKRVAFAGNDEARARLDAIARALGAALESR